MVRKTLISIFSIFLFLVLSTTGMTFDEYSGWWFIEGKSGTGLSLEIQGDTLFAALYSYDPFGTPIWLSSPSSKIGKSKFEGNLQEWSGWPFGGTYMLPSNDIVGLFTIDFISSNQANLTYTTINPFDPLGDDITISALIKKFMPTMFNGSLDSRDINGWWYDPSYNGMGWFMEARGNVMFLAWYHYDETGFLPDWHSCYGSFPQGNISFVCNMQHWQGGSGLGMEPYQAPSYSTVDQAQLVLNADGSAYFYWHEHTYHLVRFKFGEPPADTSGTDSTSDCRSQDDLRGIWIVKFTGTFWESPWTYYVPMKFSGGTSSGTVESLAEGLGKGTFKLQGENVVFDFVPSDQEGIIRFSGKIKDATYMEGNDLIMRSPEGENKQLGHWEAKRSQYCSPPYDVRGAWQLVISNPKGNSVYSTLFNGSITAGDIIIEQEGINSSYWKYYVDGDFVFFVLDEDGGGYAVLGTPNHMKGSIGGDFMLEATR